MLEKIYLLLCEMKLTMEYACLPMYELICVLSAKGCYEGTFIIPCKELLDKGQEFPDAWRISVRNDAYLSAPEKDRLLQLGGFLGTSDLKSQVSVIDMYIISFDEYKKEAVLKSRKYAGTVIYTGVFCALGLFVMLL